MGDGRLIGARMCVCLAVAVAVKVGRVGVYVFMYK